MGGIGEWKSYTSKRQIRDILADRRDTSLYWIATSGGLLFYNPSLNTFREFTTSEGLRTNNITAIACGNNGAVWIGSENGLLHKYNPSTGEWLYFSQIADDQDHGADKTINQLTLYGDTLYIVSDIGISLLSVSDGIFIENYLHSLVDHAAAFVISDGVMYVGSPDGIAYTPLSNPNPSAPDLWKLFTTTSGLPSNKVNAMAMVQGSVVACTENGIAYLTDSTWHELSGTSGMNVTDIVSSGVSAYCISSNQLLYFTLNGGITQINSFTDQLSTIGKPSILGTENNGLLIHQDAEWIDVLPPGPPSNKFIGIAVDKKGFLWSGTGARNGEGFMSYDGKEWKLYSKKEYPAFRYNEFYKVSVGRDNTKWLSNWGGGIVRIDDEGVVKETFNTTNGIPPCIPSDTTYAVVGGVAEDESGVVWITSRTPPGDTILTQYLQAGGFSYLRGCILGQCGMRNPYKVFTDVLIDYYGTKWFANYSRFESESPLGLYYYNENITLPGTTLGWGKLTTVDGLTSDKVWSLAVDKDGGLWVGSDQGITIVFYPNSPRASISAYHPLRDQVIQAIVVDECDNKWIATKRGVFVLSPDGTSILDQYTVESTGGKLLDDDVNSIDIDHKTGTVYMATENGLSALTTSAVTPALSYSDITISPNPFYIPGSNTLTIDGLVRSSSIKILTMSGRVVKEFTCPCGRIGFWDGKDEEGNYVATGIYLVVAYADNGNTTATAKLAVIRK
jgi:streptogramin lyase